MRRDPGMKGGGEAGMAHAFDQVIRGGTLADRTRGPLREADVAIRDGRIAAVGTIPGSGAEEIDARGLLVTPASSTSTPITMTRRHGTIAWPPPAGTASPPR